MKKLLLALLLALLLLPGIAAAVTNQSQYIRTGCTYNGDGTASACAASAGAAGAFYTVAEWENQNRNLVSEDKNLTVYMQGGTCDTAAQTFDGWTTDATRAIRIEELCLKEMYGVALTTNISNLTLYKPVIHKTTVGAKNTGLLINTGNNVMIERGYFKQKNMTRDSGTYVVALGTTSATFRNNLVYGCRETCMAIIAATGTNLKIYSNTIVGGQMEGIEVAVDTGHADAVIDMKNNLVTNNTGGDFVLSTGSASMTYEANMSADATSPNADMRSATINYANPSVQNYSIVAPSDNINRGVTIASFSDDLDGGTARSGKWDIGCYDTNSADGINLFLLHAEGY